MALDGAAKAEPRLIVWCKRWGLQIEPDPAQLAERDGAGTQVLDWRERLVCSRHDSRRVDMVVTGTKRG